jgi:4-hydroxy-tetrahydrodipicolinate synthase
MKSINHTSQSSDSSDKPHLGRVLTAMVTPFNAAGEVDYAAAEGLADYLIQNGSDGLVVSGTTGESPTLTHDEKIQLFKTIKQSVGARATVLAGVGSYNTQETIDLAIAAEGCGVDGLLLVAPYYNRPSQEGVFQHFTAVANATGLPIMLYNVPGRTITNIEAITTIRLSEHPRIVAIKEASANMMQVGEIVHGAPDLAIYSGADEVNYPLLALGSVGTVSVISHLVGKDLSIMYESFAAGDVATARAIHLRTLALTRAMFSYPSPVPTKTALAMLGVLGNAHVRLPMVPASDTEKALVQAALQGYGLLS